MKNLIILALIVSLFASCDMEKGYVCTCYYADGTEMRNSVEFFQRDVDYDKSLAEWSAVEVCKNEVYQPRKDDSASYATCIKKRIERR